MPAIGLSIYKPCNNKGTTNLFNATTSIPITVNITSVMSMDSAISDSGVECEREGEMVVTAYYSAFVVLFQFGWATVQISHLSMIPDITSNENSRMALTSIRYAATVTSNILVYCVTLLFLENSKHNIDLGKKCIEVNETVNYIFVRLSLLIPVKHYDNIISYYCIEKTNMS